MDEQKTVEQKEGVGAGMPSGRSTQAEEQGGTAKTISRCRKISRKQRKSIRRMRRDGAFWKGVEYANIMEQLDVYIGRFEGFKKILLALNQENLPDGMALVHDFIDGEWLDILHFLPDSRQVKKFQHMFDTVNVVLMLQCFHILDRKAKEMGEES